MAQLLENSARSKCLLFNELIWSKDAVRLAVGMCQACHALPHMPVNGQLPRHVFVVSGERDDSIRRFDVSHDDARWAGVGVPVCEGRLIG